MTAIYNNNQPIAMENSLFFLLILTFLTTLVHASALCSDPLCNIPLTAQCNNGFCQCNSELIFNCTTYASSLAQGNSQHIIISGQEKYFTLETELNTDNVYYIALTDDSNIKFLDIYDVGIYIDEGVGAYYSYPSGYAWTSSNSIQIQLQTKLTQISGTTIPQQLILNVTYTGTGTSTFSIEYSYSNTSYSELMLILGYVAGGVLVLATIVMVVIMWRRSRQEDEAIRRRQGQESKNTEDISHFNALMPIAMVTPKIIQEGAACSVCLGQFDFNSMIRTTVCGHVFHCKCLDEWCAKNLSCPICRTNLSKQSILEYRKEQSKKQNSNWVHNTLHLPDEEYQGEGNNRTNNKMHQNEQQWNSESVSDYTSRPTMRESLLNNSNL